MDINEYISKAKEIISRHDLEKYLTTLLDYWEKYPTTLGHGLEHVIRVAVQAYEVAEMNNYPSPDYAFVGGLFHDIYRPAEGDDGGEDQTKGAEVVKELFSEANFDREVTELVVGAILSHDDWRDQKEAPLFDLIISVADKASHSTSLTNSYTWASNKFLKEHGKPAKYTSHLINYYGFVKYQVRAWEVFMKHPIKGTERAIKAYQDIVLETIEMYRKDPVGKDFLNIQKNMQLKLELMKR